MSLNFDENRFDDYLHASRITKYRSPFGAQPTDSDVHISFRVPQNTKGVTFCYVYGLYDLSYHEEPMYICSSSDKYDFYDIDLMLPHEAGILFYWFKFRSNTVLNETSDDEDTSADNVLYYVSDADTLFGTGKVYNEPPHVGANENKYPYAWQITCYERGYKTPDFMKGSMIYQIFPDRFSRDQEFDYEKMINTSSRNERIYHENWYEDVDIKGKKETGYLACDFFGGSIKGIISKLPYIKSLGTDIIYLNPVFMARSSHRYDTADYLNIDPILGTNEDFEELTYKASQMGIKIIIDGVFSHTGADSIYFNKFKRYEAVGAYESYKEDKESPYRSWYSFSREKNGDVTYQSWWGFPDLPNVNENDLSYRKFIFGDNGVVSTWINRGIGGIRLDVSDELPDSFIRQMRDTIKSQTDNEGMLIGEVWEDASNKCSYGSYRDFLLGRTHDSVMGYTFRDIILSFLNGVIDARTFCARLEGFKERYPEESFYCIMNLISSHDVPRAMTIFGEVPHVDARKEQRQMWVSDEKLDLAIHKMRMAYMLQLSLVGCPTTYYGDEILMEGYKDPFNRRTYPWNFVRKHGEKQLEFVQKLADFRQVYQAIRTGFIESLYVDNDVYIFKRYLDDNLKDVFGNQTNLKTNAIIVVVNRSSNALEVTYQDDQFKSKFINKGACNEYISTVKRNRFKVITDEWSVSFCVVE